MNTVLSTCRNQNLERDLYLSPCRSHLSHLSRHVDWISMSVLVPHRHELCKRWWLAPAARLLSSRRVPHQLCAGNRSNAV